ncbi:MAG: DUF3160 domain-containing protein, partial [Verrucomicrobiae bacterium]|nr:DUF3160 domain-containing protein [Verrucomicrobiae bacterium]
MQKTASLIQPWLCIAAAVLASPADYGHAKGYNLDKVEGIENFVGPKAARKLLAKNGFVVSEPFFKQIFEPYVESPLPVFITPDSAWHTYQVLLEEGVKQLEQVQARRLGEFSRQLLAKLQARLASGEHEIKDLVWYVSIGLALQDRQYRESLAPPEKNLVETLEAGDGIVHGRVGFPLSAASFRATSFYTTSQDLADYFSARQWYATVVFRLQNDHETRLAFKLAALIQAEPSLSNLWFQLTAPYHKLVGGTEDGDVRVYCAVLKKEVGTEPLDAALEDRLDALRRKLDELLPEPQVNDQLLAPDQYAEFGKTTKGFRLLPPARLPCAVTFNQTTDPHIPGRMYPSGLDFFVASPTLRSPAAVRALELQAGKSVTEAVLRLNCDPLPDSLYGEAMKLLATLQKPLPQHAPPPLQTEAWSDLQLWTQLGAWAEQRHTWALHTKLSVLYLGDGQVPAGVVAPYPEFFSGLARLARTTANALEDTGVTEQFSVRSVAEQLLSQLRVWAASRESLEKTGLDPGDFVAGEADVSQFARFFEQYIQRQRSAERGTAPDREKTEEKALAELEAIAKQAAETGQASPEAADIFRQFAAAALNIPRMLCEFANVCEKLAELATKQLKGERLADSDAEFIRGYGATLARFHFYEGNSYLEPRDDFPIVTRVFINPLNGGVLYAGLGRPQALYVILPDAGAMRLYRGAVITYREFVRDAAEPLDDRSWRDIACSGAVPPPPMFTRSFYAELSTKELISLVRLVLRQARRGKPSETVSANLLQFENVPTLLAARATENDLPALISLVRSLRPGSDEMELAGELAPALVRATGPADMPKLVELLVWLGNSVGEDYEDVLTQFVAAIGETRHEKQLTLFQGLLGHTNRIIAQAAARLLVSRPQAIDVESIVAQLDGWAPASRAIACRLLGVTHTNPIARAKLIRACDDPHPAVRFSALASLYEAGVKDDAIIRAITNRVNDTNLLVAIAAIRAIGRLGIVEAAPLLLAKLELEQTLSSAPARTNRARATEICDMIPTWLVPTGVPTRVLSTAEPEPEDQSLILKRNMLRIFRNSQLRLLQRYPPGKVKAVL